MRAAAACGLQPTSVSALDIAAGLAARGPVRAAVAPKLPARLRLGNAERSPQGREGAYSQAPLPGNDRGNAASESSFAPGRTALEIHLNSGIRTCTGTHANMHATLCRRLAPSGQFPARSCQSHRPQRSRARPRHACRRRPGAARRGSLVKYSVASRSPPCVRFTVGALHPARLEPT